MKIQISKPKMIAGIDFGTTESLIKSDNYFKRIFSRLYFYDNGLISTQDGLGKVLFVIESVKRLLTEQNRHLHYIGKYDR